MARNNGDDMFGNGGDGPGRMMMPMGGMGMPMIVQVDRGDRSPQPQLHRHAEEPPVRAQMAMEYLKMCAAMGLKRPVPYTTSANREGGQEMDLKVLDGHELTAGEVGSQEAAADLLAGYFSGKMVPNAWEQADLVQTPTAEMNCLVCIDPSTGRPQKGCPFCGGTGKMQLVLNPTYVKMQSLDAKKVDAPALPDAPATPPARSSRRPGQ